MNILSWNVAGLRARMKEKNIEEKLTNDIEVVLFEQEETDKLKYKFDIVCLQETKCKEEEVILTEKIRENYPYRMWNSTNSESQRKGLSGTSIWSKKKPIRWNIPEFDNEGRIIFVEFEEFYLINVYVPNSQQIESLRYYFRESWNKYFINYLNELNIVYKKIIICGDMNVAHKEIDISNPKTKINKVPGFYNSERESFTKLLQCKFYDIFRIKYNEEKISTYWSNFIKHKKNNNNGWRIDYFLLSHDLFINLNIQEITCKIFTHINSSDHSPLILSF